MLNEKVSAVHVPLKKALRTKDDLDETLLTFVARGAGKLRLQGLYCRGLSVFVEMSIGVRGGCAATSAVYSFPVATADTLELRGGVTSLLQKLYRSGIAYKKAGVVLMDLTSQMDIQPDFFDQLKNDRQRRMSLMAKMDKLNGTLGKDKLRFLGSGIKGPGIQRGLWCQKVTQQSGVIYSRSSKSFGEKKQDRSFKGRGRGRRLRP